MSQINKAPPFLELSKSTIQNLDASALDIENVLSIWTGLTKCSNFISNGKRLENMSWRIVNRNLVYSSDLKSISTANNQVEVVSNELSTIGSKPKNKLNDSDFLGLLSIVADQGLFQRPQLTKRKSSNKNLTIRNKSNESLNRPSMFRHSSSSKSLRKFNSQKKKSSSDLSSLHNSQNHSNSTLNNNNTNPHPHPVRMESDTDLFEQPHPRLAFGVIDNKDSDKSIQAPKPTRSDTSTSIIRGFDPNRKEPEATKPVPQPQTKSLFGNPKPQKHQLQPEAQSSKPQKFSSLFALAPKNQHIERVKSPLSKDSTDCFKLQESNKPTSLFQSQQQSDEHQKQNSEQTHPQHQRTKTLFDQVGISPEVRKTIPSKSKRNNVLNNLGMTSLSTDSSRETKDKKMFFIESSPSPTESVNVKFHDHSRADDSTKSSVQHSRSKNSLFGGHSSNSSRSSSTGSHQKQHHNTSPQPVQQNKEKQSSGSRNNSNKSTKKKSVSLFADNSRKIEFASDSDSISDESDWSSVSESDDEEYDNKLREQWEKLEFKRKDETLSRPQFKRSLLSGLFLSEMDPMHHNPLQHLHYHHHRHQQQHLDHPKSGTITPAESELSSSISSHIQIKHRHSSATNNEALELATAAAPSVISTSHVNVSGLVNNNDEPYSEKHTDLKAKLAEHNAETNPSTSFSSMISKSALNLTNYFGHHRKNSFSSIASDRTRLKFKHESNAPPTASTILPTALSTHMFLPNAHQKAKSKLAAVVESSYTPVNQTRDLATANEDEEDDNSYTGRLQSPVLPTPKKPITLPDVKNTMNHESENLDAEFNQIAGRLSPKTTRRQMLATELSDSLRKSILWDRKHSYPANGIKAEEVKEKKKVRKKKTKEHQTDVTNNGKTSSTTNNENNQSNINTTNNNEMHTNQDLISSREGTNATITTTTSDDYDRLNDKFIREANNNEWSDEEDNFYTRGW